MLHYIFKKHFKKYTIVLPHRRISCPLNSEDKGDVTKLKICEIMGYLRISRKNEMKNVHLLKFNLLVQIGREVYEHQLTLMTPNKSFLNRLDLNVYNPSQS